MMDAAKQVNRKFLFIDSDVQGALVRRLLVHFALFMLVTFAALLFGQETRDGLEQPISHHLGQMWQQYALLFVALGCILPAMVLDLIQTSHRFVGPIYSLRDAVKKLADGRPTRTLKFRKDDHWREMANDFNRLAERLDQVEASSNPTGIQMPPLIGGFDMFQSSCGMTSPFQV